MFMRTPQIWSLGFELRSINIQVFISSQPESIITGSSQDYPAVAEVEPGPCTNRKSNVCARHHNRGVHRSYLIISATQLETYCYYHLI